MAGAAAPCAGAPGGPASRRHEETMAALATQSRALETVIERTAPAALRQEA